MKKLLKWLERFKWFRLIPPSPPKDLTEKEKEKEKEEEEREIIIRVMSKH